MGKRQVAAFLAQKRRELFFQGVTHPAMLANNSFRLRNKLFDSRAKNSVDFTMKTPFGRFLVVGLGLLASGLYAGCAVAGHHQPAD